MNAAELLPQTSPPQTPDEKLRRKRELMLCSLKK
jgi:hypothetical protein